MSTTATYKGNIIATVNNNTKTLKTAGKYMEGDVILTDVSENQAITITDELDENGGTIRHINGIVVAGTKTITENGTGIDVTAYSAVDVNVPSGVGTYQAKTNISPTTSSQTITPDSGYDALSSVQINAMPSGTAKAPSSISGSSVNISTGTNQLTFSKTIAVTPEVTAGYISSGTERNVNVSLTGSMTTKASATIHPSTSDQQIDAITFITGNQIIKGVTSTNLLAENIKKDVVVKIGDSTDDDCVTSITGTYEGGGSYQAKTGINPSTSTQTITPDSGYDALSSVQINAMPSLTLPTSASASATSGYTSKATISRSTSDQYINIGTGYNAAGAYYKVNATPNGSVTAPSSISGTSATVSTGTNTLTLTKTVSVTPNVTTAGYISSGTAGNASVSLTASVTTQAAKTIHPSTTDQSIAASRYLTGAQTIKAVTHNLDATKILSGTTFKIGDSTDDDCVTSVAGSVTFQTIYSGSSAPSSSTGVDGDVYIQT